MNLCSTANKYIVEDVFELNGDTLSDSDHNLDLLLFDYRSNFDTVRAHDARLKLCVDLAHASENKIQGWNQVSWLGDLNSWALVEASAMDQSSRIITTPYMLNRSMAYYRNHVFKKSPPWYWTSNRDFELSDLTKEPTKIFLSPVKCYDNRPARAQIFSHLVDRYHDLGYVSYWPDSMLPPNGLTEVTVDTRVSYQDVQGYRPVHNCFYNDSYVSVYCETLEHGSTQLTTEKTWDPLIKGHFILPYGHQGLIKSIADLGFELPDFIDYSYDQLSDQSRPMAYIKELDRVMAITMDKWQQHWLDNLQKIQHNRNLLLNMNYHCINYEKYMRSI